MDVSATAMLPQPDADLARSALRARLRGLVESRQIPEAALEGATMLVAGPTEVSDAAGRTWFRWTATLRMRPPAPAGPRRVQLGDSARVLPARPQAWPRATASARW